MTTSGDSKTLLESVRKLMLDGQWRTLGDIMLGVGGASEASISARLRDLRKPKFGALPVERRPQKFSVRVYEYRIDIDKLPDRAEWKGSYS
jgi:hypothetical protein